MLVRYKDLSFERLGHASVRIETPDGRVTYVDPWSEVVEAEPHDADVVFVTHDDFDHYDPDGIAAVSTDETTVVAYEGVATDELPQRVVTLPYRGDLTIADIRVRAVPAHNQSDGQHVDEDGAPFHAEGEVVGLHLTFDDVTVYYPSDTDFLDDHEGITADVFIPPIGGHFTMDRHEAARFAESVGATLVLPVHYDTFESIEADAAAFKRDVEDRGPSVSLF